TDNNSKASLINSVLPYAQRYVYSVHPDVYDVLKCSWGLKHPSCLRVVEVKKLAYINVIKKCGIKSNKRIKSNCLLQDGILYTTNESDTHSLFRELSRFLLAGFPELPLANFLQMIITMTQSGSLVDKMEIFISDNQKLLNLPCEDSQWSLAYSSAQMSHGVTERLIKTDGDWIIKGNPASTSTIPSVILEEDEASKEVLDSVIDMNVGFKGIEECGPKVLVQVLTSLCRSGSLKLMGLSWLSSWLNKLFLMLVNGAHHDVLSSLRQLPFIPLLDGIYASKNEGAIWMDMDEHGFKTFGKLYSKLRFVNPALFNDHSENMTCMLYKVGCRVEKEHILSQLREKAYIYTNHGHKRLADVPIRFGKNFGNPFDMSKLVSGTGMKWFEIDIGYLKHPVCQSLSKGSQKWRKFLRKLGVSDFVKIVEVKKGVWDSQELTHLLSHISSKGDKEKSKYLLKVLNNQWDSNFGNKPFTSYVIKILNGIQWLVSDKDTQLHFPKDLFHDCELVREVVSDRVPYVVPKVNNVKFVNDIGLKNTITLDDALSLLDVWRRSKTFRASISQMSKLYTCIWNEMSISKQKIVENLHSQAFIFVPQSYVFTNEVVIGLFLSRSEVYWHDDIVSLMEQTRFDKTHRPFSNMLCNVYPALHDFFVNELGVAENPPLGIPSLSEIVTRDAVYYGQTDNNSKASLINSVLPYAQRYVYSVHPDVYDVLKCSWGLKHPSCLRVVESIPPKEKEFQVSEIKQKSYPETCVFLE
nr:hypothetical protein [Tanacetum cinerariifolium]